jgi:hypothetical protein
MINLSANYQMLTAEDAIKPYALNELALVVADSDSINKITLNKGDLVKLTESLKDRHE